MNIVKPILAIAMLFFNSMTNAQSTENETITNLRSDKIYIESNYADLVIKTWDGKDIKVASTVSINGEEHNDSYSLSIRNSGEGVYIDAHISTKSLKQKVVFNHEDGSKTYKDFNGFDNLDFDKENENVSINIGYNIDAKVVLLVPERMQIKVSTTYGDVNMNGEYSSLNVSSTYGMLEAKLVKIENMNELELVSTYDIIDLALDPSINANLSMSTSYGEVYSDLNLKASQTYKTNSCGSSSSYKLNNGGTNISLVSTYDNIYLRSLKSL